MLLSVDIFGAPIPTFNLKGEQHVRTYCGSCVSLMIIYVTFLFAILKLQHLFSMHNPTVNTYVEREALDENEFWRGDESIN